MKRGQILANCIDVSAWSKSATRSEGQWDRVSLDNLFISECAWLFLGGWVLGSKRLHAQSSYSVPQTLFPIRCFSRDVFRGLIQSPLVTAGILRWNADQFLRQSTSLTILSHPFTSCEPSCIHTHISYVSHIHYASTHLNQAFFQQQHRVLQNNRRHLEQSKGFLRHIVVFLLFNNILITIII